MSLKNKISLGFYLSFTVWPLSLGLLYALLYSFGLIGLLSDGFTLKFWARVISNPNLVISILYSLYITLASLLPSVLIALLLATWGRKSFQSDFWGVLLYFPLTLPAVVVAFFSLQLWARGGFFSRILWHLNWIEDIQDFPDLTNDFWSWGILSAHYLMGIPFLGLVFLSMYSSERIADLEKVAAALGAKPLQIWWKISLPVLLQKAYPTIILYGIFLLGAYEIPLLLGRQSPQMISVLITRKLDAYDLSTRPEAYLMALIYSAIVFVLLYLLLKIRPKK